MQGFSGENLRFTENSSIYIILLYVFKLGKGDLATLVH